MSRYVSYMNCAGRRQMHRGSAPPRTAWGCVGCAVPFHKSNNSQLAGYHRGYAGIIKTAQVLNPRALSPEMCLTGRPSAGCVQPRKKTQQLEDAVAPPSGVAGTGGLETVSKSINIKTIRSDCKA